MAPGSLAASAGIISGDLLIDAGLLIHEGQLTYESEGLKKIADLGEWWSARTDGLPLPLGGNVIRRDLGSSMIGIVSRLLHDSIAYGLNHRQEALINIARLLLILFPFFVPSHLDGFKFWLIGCFWIVVESFEIDYFLAEVSESHSQWFNLRETLK